MTVEIHLRQIRETEYRLQQHMRRFGYDLIDVPMIANADIFLTRAGNTIIEELFTFERFGQLLALRPEFTAAVAYRYTQTGYTEPVRWQLSGAIFVDEPSDYSLQYQQHNIGAELIGQEGTMADAEIIAMAVQGVDALAVSDWQVVIGHVGLQLHLLSQFDLDSRTYRILLTQRERLKEDGKQAVLDYLNEILTVDDHASVTPSATDEGAQQMLDVLLDSTRYGSTMGGRTRHDIAARLLKKHDRGLESTQISQALDFLHDWGQIRGTASNVVEEIKAFIVEDDTYGQGLFDSWLEILNLLRAYGISEERIILQPDLTKNWDYYTGIVFGIRAHDSYIASGGRYDGLTQLLGGDAFPAVGFAYYTHRLLNALPELTTVNDILTLSSDNPHAAIKWAAHLREAGLSIQIVSENADIIIDGDSAIYQSKTVSQDELIQELIQ